MRQFSPRTHSSVCGFTLVELLVTVVSLLIVMAGLYAFLSKNFGRLGDEDAKRRINQRAALVQQLFEREFRQIGYNPRRSVFEMSTGTPGQPPSPIGGINYRYCSGRAANFSGWPIFNAGAPLTTRQICFGILDARYYKLQYSFDADIDGVVDRTEVRAIILRNKGTGAYYNPGIQNPAAANVPPLVNLGKVDTARMVAPAPPNTPPLVVPPTDPPEQLNLLSVPTLCTATALLTEQYDIYIRSFDTAGVAVNKILMPGVVCLGFAYFRQYADYEACVACSDATSAPVQLPAACLTKPVVDPLPFDYFTAQAPILTESEAKQGLVLMRVPDNHKQALNVEDAYNTYMIKAAVILEDDKIVPGYVNPLTGRPFATERVDISYVIPPANRPCDTDHGSCLFNNKQCLP